MTKLAIITTHPIQYYAPVFRLLAQNKAIQLCVFYTWGAGSVKKYDQGFGKTVEWDIPLLEGYPWKFVENTASDPGTHHFSGIRNPHILTDIAAFSPDVILVYGWSWQSHLRVIRHFSGKIPLWFRGDSTLLGRTGGWKDLARSLFLKWVYRKVDKAFYAGAENKAYFLKYGLTEEQLVFAPHAVDNDRFAAGSSNEAALLKKSLGIPVSALVILSAGKLDENKNVTLLLDAFNDLEDHANVHLVIAGDGSERARLEQAANKEKVHFTGFINQLAMPALYHCCDLFCLPSLSETWGLAVNEAMAAGKAVLVSDQAGCKSDLVENGKNGGIFSSEEKDELVAHLSSLLANPVQLEAMGRRSAELISDYSFTRQAAAFEQEIRNEKK